MMTRIKYDEAKESRIIGAYPPARGAACFGPDGLPSVPRTNRPIEARENFRMLFSGKTPYWIPDCGPLSEDITAFRPRQHPDNLANHQAVDGGDALDFDKLGDVIKGWFGIPYRWMSVCNGATTVPGMPLITDIEHWEDEVTFPDLDAWDWDEIGRMNKDYLATDRMNQLAIQFGFWERLMNAMGTSEAAIALISEDEQDGVHRFFDRLADLYIDYIQRMSRYCRIDSLVLHDDWGHSTGPFFSLATCREMLVPHMKRVADTCHALGMIYEQHCCGKSASLVPAMIDIGADYWAPQPETNDIDSIIETYRGAPLAIGIPCPKLAPSLTDAEVDALAKDWVDQYKGERILVSPRIISDETHDAGKYGAFKQAVYRYSRIAYQDCE